MTEREVQIYASAIFVGLFAWSATMTAFAGPLVEGSVLTLLLGLAALWLHTNWRPRP